ncbi:hypothetical protein [Jiangella alkaliphila]|uniref:Uncharacterized protein n=1 Tax=Jiangella alkaliphila TaxID=419479 RepID=A0A1H2JYH3_9ACTN|nr:hypothetical protein [Jiangella alkaliphila]SDU61362.1 hypothetical protein SAMN04488563_3211 [Jiangella alkaliphila]
MTDETITQLRGAAATTEPPAPFDLDAAVRGGRARVRRRRRTGAGVVAAAVAVAAGLALPSSPASVFDGEAARQPRTEDVPQPVVAPVVADDPMKSAVWAAVDEALPPDVEPVADIVGDPVEPSLALQLRRGDQRFAATVIVHEDPAEAFRPCSEPTPELGVTVAPWPCVEGEDDAGRWRVQADVLGGGTGLVSLVDGTNGVLVTWDVLEGVTLTRDEGTALAEAALSVAAEGTIAWSTGVDLEATEAGWDELRSAVEAELDRGALTELSPPDFAIEDTGRGQVIGRYVLPDGVEVEVEVWQRAAPYDAVCLTVTNACSPLPGQSVETGQDERSGQEVSTQLGSRAVVALRIASYDQALDSMVAAVERVAELLPRTGD